MMGKQLTIAALFILCASLPLGASAKYRKADLSEIKAGHILWAQPKDLSPTYIGVRSSMPSNLQTS